MWHLILWVVAVVLVLYGAWQIVNRAVLFGLVLIALGLLVGPGGVSILS